MNQNEIRNLEDSMDYGSYEGLEFLNESQANMVEDEVVGAILLDDLGKEPTQHDKQLNAATSGFQLVTSKAMKKSQKQNKKHQ